MYNREAVVELVKSIKAERGLSYRDLAELADMPQSRLNSHLFKKNSEITDEVVHQILYPLMFVEHLHGPDVPRARVDPAKVRWANPEEKGWIPVAEVRDMMIELRDELGTDWQRLADFAGMNRVVFTKGFQKNEKRYVSQATVDKYRMIANRARALSPQAKQEAFTPRIHKTKTDVSRSRFIALMSNYRVDYGLPSWKAVGEDIGVDGRRIYNLVRDKRPKMRLGVYNEIIDAMMAASHRREARRGFVVGSIDARYNVTDGGERRKYRAKERASAA